MKASVVIPVYNKAPWLQECLASVLAQMRDGMEVICVDDRSTDESLQVLRGTNDPRLRIIALETNIGPAGCAQRGFDAAQGEYIVRMDADDVMHPDRIERQVAFMDAHPEIGASGSHMELLHEPGTVRRASLTDAECRAAAIFRIPLFQPSTIYRRNVLVEHGIRFQDDWPRYGEDWLFQLRLMRATRLANMDAALVRYRVTERSLASRRDDIGQQRVLFTEILRWFGLPHGDHDLRMHLNAVKCYPHPLAATDIGEMKAYLDSLRTRVRGSGLFPAELFGLELDRVWDDLAYQLPRFDRAVTFAYLRHDHRRSWTKLRYLLSSVLRARVYLPAAGEA
jgi:glycosyltransferase involved in cell wall biosynthesis